MRIDIALPPSAAAPARRSRAEAADGPPAPGAPTEDSAPASRGRGADHRSEVATLRQWVNHPELRASTELPDLEGSHPGQGFAKAVAAYQAVVAETAPPAVTPPVDETPVVTPPVDEVVVPAPEVPPLLVVEDPAEA